MESCNLTQSLTKVLSDDICFHHSENALAHFDDLAVGGMKDDDVYPEESG